MVILLRYGEIHLKGMNRPYFEQKLRENILAVLREYEGVRVKRVDGRFILHGFNEEDLENITNALKKVFGLHSFSIAYEADKDFENVKAKALEIFKNKIETSGAKTFKVQSKRSDKKYIYNTMEISRELGGYLLSNVDGISVDVHNPEVVLYA